MNKHTQEPWIKDSDGWCIQGNILENQDLIAAAPRLLDALYCLLESINGNHVTIADCNQAIAAIAKATGEKE